MGALRKLPGWGDGSLTNLTKVWTSSPPS